MDLFIGIYWSVCNVIDTKTLHKMFLGFLLTIKYVTADRSHKPLGALSQADLQKGPRNVREDDGGSQLLPG
ncbi:hypothetical protein L596_006625 [Steinernema carpocapsae]|uniref:Uncharacterized protein n=1 Tax=Steinernema carpocapsae TaxID=34508 RepID=A0A4U8V2Y4_STECR|nr:hypothetical protein L596_006625 [Steinernema carpocapsae]